MSTVHLPRRSSSRTLKTSNSQLAYLLSEDVTSSIRKILAARGILLFESSDRADLASGLRVYFSKRLGAIRPESAHAMAPPVAYSTIRQE